RPTQGAGETPRMTELPGSTVRKTKRLNVSSGHQFEGMPSGVGRFHSAYRIVLWLMGSQRSPVAASWTSWTRRRQDFVSCFIVSSDLRKSVHRHRPVRLGSDVCKSARLCDAPDTLNLALRELPHRGSWTNFQHSGGHLVSLLGTKAVGTKC